jgi:hypothetical protein
MKHLRALGWTAVAVAALAAYLGAGFASASELYRGGTTVGVGTEVALSVKSGTSTILKDTNNATVDTCTGSSITTKVENSGGWTEVTGPVLKIYSLTFSGCSHKTQQLGTTLKTQSGQVHVTAGRLEINQFLGTTNGTVNAIGVEWTVESTVFGASCIAKTGAGTKIGTLTGSSSGNATIDLNGVVPMGLCGDAVWTGTYAVTSPTPLGVEKE